jgi:hypothetical protein
MFQQFHKFFTENKKVEVNSTGHTKDRLTACLVATSDSRKLVAHVVFRGKRQPKLRLPSNVTGGKPVYYLSIPVVDVAQHGTMTTSHIFSWVNGPFRALRSVFHRPAVFVMDSYGCHLKKCS